MSKKIFGAVIRVIISFGLIGVLLFIMREHLHKVLGLLLNIKPDMFAAALFFFIASQICIVYRLKQFLAGQNILINFKEATGLTVIGYFFNNFLPTSIGGDVVKAYYASKKAGSKANSFAAVFMDRLIGSIALIFLTLFAFLFLKKEITKDIPMWPMWLLFFGMILFLALLFNERFSKMVLRILPKSKVFDTLQKLYSSLTAFKGRKLLFLNTFAVSIAAQVFAFVAVYFFIKGMYDYVPLMQVILIMPIICIASMMPSINGLGVREGAFLVFFKPLIGIEKAFAVGVLYLLMFTVLSIFGGMVYAFARHGKLEKPVYEFVQ